MGFVAGQRSMTPLAAVAAAARQGTLPPDALLREFVAHPVIAGGTVALAAAEMAGDKMKSAPDRIVPLGLIARTLTAAYAGAALARPGERVAGGAVAVACALGSSYIGWRMRCAAMDRYGQTATGVAEDALVLGSALTVALSPGLDRRG
ncbi:DUF4126 domain-containing protein [Aurantiacibacter arachoides]|nr:DUF4126 domain-containing protein [Aurantiacibacter arachoides]